MTINKWVAGFGLFLLPAGGVLYASQTVPSETAAPPEINAQGEDTFVATWLQIQEQRRRAIVSLGKEQQFEAVLAQVRNVVRRDPDSFVSATNAQAIPELYLREIAQYLISVGVGPGDLPRDQVQALATIKAAERAVTAGLELTDKRLLAQYAVRAKPINIVADTNPDDGFNSTATFVVTGSLKGNVPIGLEIAVRYSSDLPRDQKPSIEGADEFVLFLSSENYRFNQAKRGRGAPQVKYMVEIFAPYRVSGDRLIPMGEGKIEALATLQGN